MPYKDPEKAKACWLRRDRTPERKAYRKRWRTAAGIRASRKYSWKTEYGLTEEDYYRLLAAQNGGCKLCGRTPESGKVLPVDHNHVTGKIRGLLCTKCNVGLGLIGDTVESLRRAIQYLESCD